jgi:hypothetical protein
MPCIVCYFGIATFVGANLALFCKQKNIGAIILSFNAKIVSMKKIQGNLCQFILSSNGFIFSTYLKE